MILGGKECDSETAYYLKYGKIKPVINKSIAKAPNNFDWENINKPDPYYCWQGTRMPQWFE